MKPIIAFSAALLVYSTAATASDTTFDHKDFQNIAVSKGIEVIVTEGEDYEITAEAKRGKIKRLIVRKKGDTLVISRKTGFSLFGSGRRDRFEVSVSLPELSSLLAKSGSEVKVSATTGGNLELDASSGALLSISGRSGGDLTLSASSGASLNAKQMKSSDVVVRASSGSTLVLGGTCDQIEAESSSGSTLRARDMECAGADLQASSGSTLSAFATQTVKAEASSGASVRIYGGSTNVEISNSSGGSVAQN